MSIIVRRRCERSVSVIYGPLWLLVSKCLRCLVIYYGLNKWHKVIFWYLRPFRSSCTVTRSSLQTIMDDSPKGKSSRMFHCASRPSYIYRTTSSLQQDPTLFRPVHCPPDPQVPMNSALPHHERGLCCSIIRWRPICLRAPCDQLPSNSRHGHPIMHSQILTYLLTAIVPAGIYGSNEGPTLMSILG